MPTKKSALRTTKKAPAPKATKSVAPATSDAPAKAPKAAKPDGKLSQLDAAVKVLAESGTPMTTKAMIEAMANKCYWISPCGATPGQCEVRSPTRVRSHSALGYLSPAQFAEALSHLSRAHDSWGSPSARPRGITFESSLVFCKQNLLLWMRRFSVVKQEARPFQSRVLVY